MRARALAVLAALVLAWAPVLPAAADTLGPAPGFGFETLTERVGGPLGQQTTIYCPPNAVLTSIPVGYKGPGPYLGAAAAACSPVVVNSGSPGLGAATVVPATLGDMPPGGDTATTCPGGQIAVGFTGWDRFDGFVDALQIICKVLKPDGTLGATPVTGPAVGAISSDPEDAHTYMCPDGAVATGIAGGYNTDYTEDDLYSFGFRCQALGFPSVTPADYNLTWATALTVGANSTTSGTIAVPGQDRWYRFPIQPGARVNVDLTDLPVDYDLTMFTDIEKAFTSLTSTADLTKLSAEFAGDAFAPSVFSPSVFSPSVFSPSVFSPSVFSPSVFSPSVFSPSVFSPSVFSPSVFSPSVFSPSVFSPSVFSPAVSLPSVFSPSVFSPSVFSPSVFSDAFASAQTRSLIGFSSRDGTAAENLSSATWNNTGYFYLRVQGRNGAASASPYTLKVTSAGGICSAPLDDHRDDPTLVGTPGSAQTVILTDPARLPGTAAEKAALASQLAAFATSVGGAVVDLGQSTRVRALNAQADDADHRSCPYAKNLVAEAARSIVNSYRNSGGTLKYVVVIGGDQVVPFFRYPDSAGLGPESNYAPPVADGTTSEASLRGNYVLGQDAYGSRSDLTIKGTQIPIPDLAVGRLVESPVDIAAALQRYGARGGAALVPTSTLATGYDFLTDAADAVASDFAAGTPGGRHDTLITDADVPPTQTTQNNNPTRRASWTATDLRTSLFNTRHDLVFLAGHFSANNTLAADYDTTVRSTELAAVPDAIFRDSLIFSAGCHSGYTIVDEDGVPGVTDGLDWTEAFAKKGATLIAGTGYQYGDTDFLEYSERLYAEFAHQLRLGTGAVPVGQALAQAKQKYLRDTASLGGIDQKSVLQATLYGLPMLGVNLPAAGRVPTPTDASLATPSPVNTDPGNRLNLSVDDLNLNPTLTAVNRPLTNLDGPTVNASYLQGPDGVSTSPAEPALPLVNANVTVPGKVLRGIALRTATYTDTNGITPLTGAPATETHSVHGPFVTPAFYPGRIATPNYFDALGGAGSTGTTRLMVTPAQHRSDAAGSLTNTRRAYSALGLRLYYSANIETYGDNVPALAAAPTFTGIRATVKDNRVNFEARVVGNPAAGLQQVFVTYTGQPGSTWHKTWASVDLTQAAGDSTRWTGGIDLPPGEDADNLRFMVQAVNGVGLVGIDDNQGTYFTPNGTTDEPVPPAAATRLVLAGATPTTGIYGDTVRVSATLTKATGGDPVAQRLVTFTLGGTSRAAVTNTSGVATTDLPLSVLPGAYQLTVGYDGDADTAPSGASPTSFTVSKQPTTLSLAVQGETATATLVGSAVGGATAGLPLREKTVYFAFANPAGTVLGGRTASTGRLGTAEVSLTERPAGASTVTAYFGASAAPVPGGTVVDLSDVSYRAATSAAVALPSTGPTAGPDSYTTVESKTLNVAKPGVLANDTAGTTAVVVTPPTSGKLTLNSDGSFSYQPTREFVGTVTFTYAAKAGTQTSTPATVTITVTESTPPGCTIRGTAGNDTLTGTSKNDVICGFGGDDVINAGAGNDIVYGGSGNDTLNGGDGNDLLDGRSGNDTLNGGNGLDALLGGIGDDKLSGEAGNDALDGSDGRDELFGGDASDALIGGAGVDKVYGGNGDDYLDVKDGAPGDLADGGAGKDSGVKDAGDTVISIP